MSEELKHQLDAQIVYCPHCNRPADNIEVRVTGNLAIFYHGYPSCKKILNCQLLSLKAPQRLVQPIGGPLVGN